MKRLDVLKNAVKPILDNDGGYKAFLCPALTMAILDAIPVELNADNIHKLYFDISNNLNKIFSAFDRNTAIRNFNGTTPRSGEVWFMNNKDRIDFANYLLDVYKDDEIEIEDILKEYKII